MNIVFVAAECAPFIKVGGLADVVGTLPPELHRLGGHRLVTIVPHYGPVDDAKYGIKLIGSFNLPWNGAVTRVEVSHTQHDDVDTYFLRGWPYFSSAEDFIYHGDEGTNVGRYLFFNVAALEWIRQLGEREGFKPDLFHIHDWHTAFVAYLLEQVYMHDPVLGGAATLFSIHNMMYQGWGVGWHIARAGLPPVDSGLLRAMGKLDNSLAIGIAFSNMLSTVSPTYAQEITTMEGGYALDGLLHARMSRMIGILNGIDVERWNPATSKAVKQPFSIETLDERVKNKKMLQKELDLPVLERIPLFGVVTRLVDQKGIDILINAMRHILWHRQAQFVVLGSGMEHFEAGMRQIEADFRGKARALIKFNEPLSERIYAGSDLFLMPSLFEPCGIGQMLAMRYGCLPIVRKVGGLADTVDPSIGFLFGPYDTWALINTIEKALDVFVQPQVWRQMQISAMSKDFAWERSAQRYLDLYRLSVDVHRAYA